MNAVSIDVDMLETLPAKTVLRIIEKKQAVTRFFETLARTLREHTSLFRFLEAEDIDLRIDPDLDIVTLHFTGDGERLKKVWMELRRHGFKPGSHPKKGDTSFTSFLDLTGASKLLMNFSSSVCKRVQVGTEMKEVPIYETQCGELPELEDASAPALVAPAPAFDTDIPF